MIANMELAKSMMLRELEKDDVISIDKAEEYRSKYIFIIIPPKWYEFWKREDEEGMNMVLVRIED
tara:strand:- start:60 stop:254 length:195 start_codon:yes stop_codon:yes gene_type:complete